MKHPSITFLIFKNNESHPHIISAFAFVFFIKSCETVEAEQRISTIDSLRCDWRVCEISYGDFSCKNPGEICDMYRNTCVQKCESGDCCEELNCPQGTTCVPGTRRCGVPVGNNCFDMGLEWWTGRDIASTENRHIIEPKPVIFTVYNQRNSPLYFEMVPDKDVKFDLFTEQCSVEKKLEVPENHFCPTPCPESGPIFEIDCGPPLEKSKILLSGNQMQLSWSGKEEVGMWRICDQKPQKYCLTSKTSLPGTYKVKICAFENTEGGRPDPSNPSLLIDSRPKGDPQCITKTFQYPAQSQIEVYF